MRTINLLPWREQYRLKQLNQFRACLFIDLIAALVIIFFINYYSIHLESKQKLRNNLLQEEIRHLDNTMTAKKRVKQIFAKVFNSLLIIENLKAHQIATVHLFDELTKVLPPGVQLIRLQKKDSTILLEGRAYSNSRVSVLLHNIENNPWMQHPVLVEIKKMQQAKDSLGYQFTLSLVLHF